MSPYLCSFSMSAGRDTPRRRAVSLWLLARRLERLGDERALERLDARAQRVARARVARRPTSASTTCDGALGRASARARA